MLDDGRTIVALATPEGRGGLAVVRVSGPEAVAVARQLVPAGVLDPPVTSHLARLATLRWPDAGTPSPRSGPLDQALVLPMLAPASYTGEDTVEFFCHGGVMPARLIIAACLAAGARAASAGEFTRRAFLNGRLSLTEAEAVADLIAAEHACGARAALSQLRGGLQRRLQALEEPLRGLLAELEGTLEFGDDEAVEPDLAAARDLLGQAQAQVQDLLELVPAGRRLRDGVQVVLVGAPNAGKSSLFNALLENERVIVDPTPGTTRDAVSAELDLGDVRFVLHDTAGLRADAGPVEARGMALTRAFAARADVVLALRPADALASSSTAALVDLPSSVRVIDVVTKIDLACTADAVGVSDVATSSLTGAGLDDLRAALVAAAGAGGLEQAAAAGIMLNQRHQSRLQAASRGLADCLEACDRGPEVLAGLLASVLQELGSVSGRVFTERMLADVFSRFCVGK